MLYDENKPEIIAVFQPYVQRLVIALCRLCQYDSSQVPGIWLHLHMQQNANSRALIFETLMSVFSYLNAAYLC